MSHITSIGAGLFTDLSVYMPLTPLSSAALSALEDEDDFQALYASPIESIGGTAATNAFVRIKNIREFPPLGTPPNVVNVPLYGSKTSQQIQGQADAPSMELTVNYVAAEWADGTLLGDAMGDGTQYVFRVSLLNAEPDGYESDTTGGAAGLGSVENSQYYFYGKIEALQVNPQLTDANTATITVTMQSEFFGAFTTNA